MRGRSSRTAPILQNQFLQVSLASEQTSLAEKFSAVNQSKLQEKKNHKTDTVKRHQQSANQLKLINVRRANKNDNQ